MKLKWLVLIIFFQVKSFAADLHIAFIVPDKQEHAFWQLVVDVAQSVALDHNIRLDVHYSDTNRFASRSAIAAITQQADKPDYIIYRPMQGTVLDVFNIIESSKIPFITLEQGFSEAELREIGQPQKKFKYWLGAVQYDDEAGGAQLTAALEKQYRKNNADKTMFITGIAGGFEQVSMARQANLKKIPKRAGPIVLNQIFPMSWSIESINENFPAIYERYPNTNAFWTVADSFALAIIEQLDMANAANKDILIGGFDWLPAAIDKIQTGEMTASVGGHYLMVGKALLNIIEYHHGNNIFLQTSKAESYELIDQDNVDLYQAFIKKAPWPEIDYRQFSSHFNSQKKPLEFTTANLLKIYNQPTSRGTSTNSVKK
jgi:ABC-type sugar transport system substrate-binding protein